MGVSSGTSGFLSGMGCKGNGRVAVQEQGGAKWARGTKACIRRPRKSTQRAPRNNARPWGLDLGGGQESGGSSGWNGIWRRCTSWQISSALSKVSSNRLQIDSITGNVEKT